MILKFFSDVVFIIISFIIIVYIAKLMLIHINIASILIFLLLTTITLLNKNYSDYEKIYILSALTITVLLATYFPEFRKFLVGLFILTEF